MAEAINAALKAGGDHPYYVWLGDDDFLVGEGISRAVAALEDDSLAVVAYGHCDYMDAEGNSLALNRAGKLARFLLPWGPNLIPHPGTVIRRDAIVRAGGFTPGYSYALDLDLFLRLRKLGSFLPIPAVTARFRWHPDSLTVADRQSSSREAMAIKKSYLPAWLRWVSPLWHWPVAWASAFVAERLNARVS
jgi:GT2 family glycosyltransferase